MSSDSATNSDHIFEAIVRSRGIKNIEDFIYPKYEKLHDPLKLPDIQKAIKRIEKAKKNNEKIAIYGDYDIDGLTATTVLTKFFEQVSIKTEQYLPDRFLEGYGMSKSGIDAIKKTGASLIITVDCGSRSLEEIKYANSLGLDVIVTDHHEVGDQLPDALAVINPKRKDSKYPWRDLAGVGVAFKLVQALQSRKVFADEFAVGQEKWLLDLVSLGTVCDVVDLLDENRTIVWWGLKVLAKTKWPGLRALALVSGVDLENATAEDFGFKFGPRLNASGRMTHAKLSLDLLLSNSESEADEIAQKLNDLNYKRQADQRRIFKEAKDQASKYNEDYVYVLADKDWSHGINGIVAAKITESLARPTFVMQILDDTTKGSARSFGDFHLADALRQVEDLTISGGGHKLAAGATIRTKDIEKFRTRLNDYYASLNLDDQSKFLLPNTDIEINKFQDITLDLIEKLQLLAPYGNNNQQPIFVSKGVKLDNWKPVGADLTHAKSTFIDKTGYKIESIGFGIAEKMPDPESLVEIAYIPQKNDFNGRVSVQIQLLTIRLA